MCAGRATHQPTSNGGENIACRNKGFEASANAVCSKKQTSRRGTGVGDGPTRRQQQHRLYEVRIESFRCPCKENLKIYVSDGVYIVRRAEEKEKKGVCCVVVVHRLDAFPGIVPHRKSAEPRPDL